jgi:PD-(D/E)XK nuclease superfamily protein
MASNAKRPHPKAVGDQTTAMVLARLVQSGKMVLLPFSENQRYDLVVDEGDRFVRIQCKTGRLRNGAIQFNACSFSYHHPNNHGTKPYMHDYRGAAELFGVYCSQTDGVYLVPVEAVGKRLGALRIEPTRNNQSKGVRWARDFELKLPG